jgi:hypothetical protein
MCDDVKLPSSLPNCAIVLGLVMAGTAIETGGLLLGLGMFSFYGVAAVLALVAKCDGSPEELRVGESGMSAKKSLWALGIGQHLWVL